MRAILDTSVLISDDPALVPEEASISVVSLAELHVGLLLARDPAERARRLRRLGFVEAEFDPIPIDAEIAREWGALASLSAARGIQSRRRAMDLLIAATARALDLPLITLDHDLEPLADVVDVRWTGGSAGK
ncbi:MAG TPA: PIN domain-containing protein [Terriglobales bacterium]|nr:PIN domain-containing protein [Terriglobales bacterium]